MDLLRPLVHLPTKVPPTFGINLYKYHLKGAKKGQLEVVVSGENIPGYPDGVECAAIGVPSESTGEAIRMYVVRSNPELSEDDVRNFMREGLTGYKVPKSVVFKDELPKTAVGKILRRELRDLD